MAVSLSLDIGTRKVVGLLTQAGPKGMRIVAAERLEHKTRTMFDGQIHDVVEVAAVVRRIVDKLSAKAGAQLREAAVAAAGRALRTSTGSAARELNGLKELTAQEVFSLELEAVQAAQQALADGLLEQGQSPQDYHYVGHSVIAHKLDGLAITSLVGQRGTNAELVAIATFLPRGVVDSFMGVLERVGLDMTALTLEPIAAISVAVPQTMRHLNLVLVDIGAGTSDIAITSKGTVTAYDMVPVAGDEVTEALSERYLLDFTAGEKVKRLIGLQESVTFVDILGAWHTVSSRDLTAACLPAVESMARQIGERILALNGGSPQAVILVGGGSQSPGLVRALARNLNLGIERVAVRGREAIANVTGARQLLLGPDCVTPIGIAVSAREQSTLGFAYVQVDNLGVRLFSPGRVTVADALLAAGISIRNLQGKVGKGITVTINGELKMVRGTFGRPAQLRVNGEPATLETPIRHRDRVELMPAQDGAPGMATVAALAGSQVHPYTLSVNGRPWQIPALITVNGSPASPETPLCDNDNVQIRSRSTVAEVMEFLGYPNPDAVETLQITVDGQARTVTRPHYRVAVGDAEADSHTPVSRGGTLLVEPTPGLSVRDVCNVLSVQGGGIRVTVNGEQVELKGTVAVFYRNGKPVPPDEAVRDGDRIEVAAVPTTPHIFAELLVKVGTVPTPPPGKQRLVMLLNGKDADFSTPLRDGDLAVVVWE